MIYGTSLEVPKMVPCCEIELARMTLGIIAGIVDELELVRFPEDDEVVEVVEVDSGGKWFPFKSKMELVGYTHNLISRSLFDQIRLILNGLCQLNILGMFHCLPGTGTDLGISQHESGDT
ncbi:hypothetical protein VP01_746g4 [Puccinia sorghi]|uniref:Uncharacterized protein n=1 Tax=Puccinia sorghi TaxID=27349 RepID=A0A0L6UD94_9BASI|nr:hypothetical protein VP01_746g4 [Puccinia sorghi]